MKTYFSKTVAC